MKNLWIKGTIALLMVISLSGCKNRSVQTSSQERQSEAAETQGHGITTDPSEAESIYQFPLEYVNAEGKVNFDTQISINENAQLDELTTDKAVAMRIDNEKIYHNLFGQTDVVTEQMIDLDNDDGSKGMAYYYNGSQGESLSITDRSFYYHDKFLNYILNAFRLEENTRDYNANLYIQNRNLSFAAQESALESILQELSLLGIDLDGNIEYTCYTLDYQTLMQEESAIDVNGIQDTGSYKDMWDENDDCYYFCIRQTQNGLPITHEYADAFGRVEDSNAPIQAIISRSGIKMLTVDKIFDFSDSEHKANVGEFNRMALSVKEKYEQLLTNSTYTVTDAALYYLSMKKEKGNYEVKPVWVFNLTEYVNDSEQTYQLQMIIDAQTGKEIIL